MEKIQFSQIEALLGKNFAIKGIEFPGFSEIGPVTEAGENGISWVSPARKDAVELLANSRAKVIICGNMLDVTSYLDQKCFIVVESPRAVFTRILRDFFEEKIDHPPGIHPSAIVSPEAKIHPSVHVGAFCVIGKCEIGTGSVILPHTRIHNSVFIGENVKIHDYCNIGGDGFGHIWNEENKIERMPHIGRLIIENDVEILQYVNIDKGTLGKTHIGEGSVLDHYVHIAHNSTVGKHSMVGAKVIFCGGSSIGDNCFIGVMSVILDGIKVGNNITIGAAATVTKAVPDGQIWAGAPAMELDKFKQLQKKLKDL